MRSLFISVGLFAFIAADAQVFSPVGLWGVEEKWGETPKELLEANGASPDVKPGVVINFCPDHQLRIAAGVLYGGGGRVALGSSDGLTLYKGTWSQDGS